MSDLSNGATNKYRKKARVMVCSWLFGNLIFGGLALLTAFLISLLDKDIVLNGHKILEQGVLLFLCVSLVGAVFVDYIICEKPKKNGFILLVICIFPLLISVFSSLVYSQLNFRVTEVDESSYNFYYLNMFQYIVVSFTLIYCIGLKYTVFVHELRNSNKATLQN